MLFLQSRTDDVEKNPDLVKKLRDIGTYWIMCGVENHSEDTLKEYKKGTKPEILYHQQMELK